MRIVQSLLLLALCVTLLVWLDALYVVPAIIAMLFALGVGMTITMAIALGALWPVLGLSYLAYAASNASRAQALRSAVSRTSEPRLTCVEDPQHREH